MTKKNSMLKNIIDEIAIVVAVMKEINVTANNAAMMRNNIIEKFCVDVVIKNNIIEKFCVVEKSTLKNSKTNEMIDLKIDFMIIFGRMNKLM